MIFLKPDNLELRDLKLDQFQEYLLSTGWQSIPHPSPNLQLFEGINDDFGKPVQLVLPGSKDLWDSSIVIAKAINLLAVIEDRSPERIVADINQRELLGTGSV